MHALDFLLLLLVLVVLLLILFLQPNLSNKRERERDTQQNDEKVLFDEEFLFHFSIVRCTALILKNGVSLLPDITAPFNGKVKHSFFSPHSPL